MTANENYRPQCSKNTYIHAPEMQPRINYENSMTNGTVALDINLRKQNKYGYQFKNIGHSAIRTHRHMHVTLERAQNLNLLSYIAHFLWT